MPHLSHRTSKRLAWAVVAACAAAIPSVAALSPAQAAVRAPAEHPAVTLAAAKAGLTHSPITVAASTRPRPAAMA